MRPFDDGVVPFGGALEAPLESFASTDGGVQPSDSQSEPTDAGFEQRKSPRVECRIVAVSTLQCCETRRNARIATRSRKSCRSAQRAAGGGGRTHVSIPSYLKRKIDHFAQEAI